MDNELAPGFIYDQGLYYPTAGNYYGYVCTGVEVPNEFGDHHQSFGVDGQNLQFSGLQSENLPSVYYTPSHEYSQSPYNPFNPYIPGAVMGNGPYLGTQQCFTNSPYLQTVSPPPGYIPVITQAGSETLLSGSPDPLLFSNGAMEYVPPLSTMSATATPLRVSFENVSLEPLHSSSHQIPVSGRLSEGTGINATHRKKFSPFGEMITGGAPQINQVTEHSSLGGFPSVRSPLKATLPANNSFTNPGSNIHGWAPVHRMRPRMQYNGIPNRSLGEQNMGPRTNKTRTLLTSAITLRSYTAKTGTGDVEGNIIIHPDQYNRDDFPADDYPGAKFFVIKSYSEDDVHKSIKYNVWSSTSSGNKKLDIAYEEAQRLSVVKSRKCPVFLFFSVNASGHFCGVAEMVGPVDFHKDMDFWLQDKWTGCFPVKWHIIKDVPNASLRHIILMNNEFRPVTSSRDTQEVQYPAGMSMLSCFKSPVNSCILDDFMYYDERQRIMHEEKSKLLAIKSYETSVSPSASVPYSKPHEAITQPPNANEQLNNAVVQPTNEKETTKELKAEDKLNDDSNPLLESDGKQMNHREKQSLETKGDQGKNHSLCKRTSRLSPNDVHSRDASKDAQNQGKTGETDVFTVGSVEIEITDTNRSISGTITIGSMPVNIK